MKSESQVRALLNTCPINSDLDWELISMLCVKSHFRVSAITTTIKSPGIQSPDFIEWFTNGIGEGDVALCEGTPVIVGTHSLEEYNIVGRFGTDGFFGEDSTVQDSSLVIMDSQSQKLYHRQLSEQGLEYCRNTHAIQKKYVPEINERVLLYNADMEAIGVVRTVDPGNDTVELYCYYNYTTKETGYSMHETGLCNFHDFHYEPISIVAYRRLNRELEKAGKVWYDKLHRIEPLTVKAKEGEKYWYITDKMKIASAIEKGTPTSHQRYIAGNYFTDFEECLKTLGSMVEILRDRLAK